MSEAKKESGDFWKDFWKKATEGLGKLFGVSAARADTVPLRLGYGRASLARRAALRGGGSPALIGSGVSLSGRRSGGGIRARAQRARLHGGGSPTGYVDGNDFYDAIIQAEGTGKHGDPYNTSLGYLKSRKPLTSMTMDEALAWGDHIRKHTAIGLRTNSSAKGAFQIVNTTQRAAMRALGLKGSDMFSADNQRRMASWIARRQGLRAWEGFKAHAQQRARAAEAMRRGVDRQRASGAADRQSMLQTHRDAHMAAAGGRASFDVDSASLEAHNEALRETVRLRKALGWGESVGRGGAMRSLAQLRRAGYGTGGLQGDG